VGRIHLMDIVIALLIGAGVGASPFTTVHFWPSFIAGCVAGGGYLAYRVVHRPAAAPTTRTTLNALRAVPISVWLCLLLFGVISAPTFVWLYGTWTGSIWSNSHGLLVPFAMAYLASRALRQEHAKEEEASARGFAFLLPGLFLIALDAVLRTQYLAAVGIVLSLPGFSLLFLGAERTRALRVALMAGVFMIPIPNAVTTHIYLRDLTSAGVEPLLRAMGVPLLRNGTAFELPSGIFIVSEACSGFATLYAALAVALILACYAHSPRRRALVLLSAVPLAVLCNIARVFSLIWLSHYLGTPNILDTLVHPASGVLNFWIVLFVLWFLAGSLRFQEERA